jgi:hypothetical protein
VLQADARAIGEHSDLPVEVKTGLIPGGQNRPLIIIVLIMIAGDLLLKGSDGETLNVRVKQTASVTDILEGYYGPERNL